MPMIPAHEPRKPDLAAELVKLRREVANLRAKVDGAEREPVDLTLDAPPASAGYLLRADSGGSPQAARADHTHDQELHFTWHHKIPVEYANGYPGIGDVCLGSFRLPPEAADMHLCRIEMTWDTFPSISQYGYSARANLPEDWTGYIPLDVVVSADNSEDVGIAFQWSAAYLGDDDELDAAHRDWLARVSGFAHNDALRGSRSFAIMHNIGPLGGLGVFDNTSGLDGSPTGFSAESIEALDFYFSLTFRQAHD